jgi:adenosylcobinamide kinase/adenosylcobinamide-phosphate guanylyltransferase
VDERGDAFETHEVPLALPEAVAGLVVGADVVVIDCVTLWLSNLLLAGLDVAACVARVDALVRAVERRSATVVVVTNEVGMGVVPATELGRAFRDLAGAANQRLAAAADEVLFAAMGVVLRLRPGPIQVEPR